MPMTAEIYLDNKPHIEGALKLVSKWSGALGEASYIN